MDEWLLTYPVWLLVSGDSVDENGRVKPEVRYLAMPLDDGDSAIIAMTDQDAARRYSAELEKGVVYWLPMESRERLGWNLHQAKEAGWTRIVFDPVEKIGTTIRVWMIDDVIRQLKVSDWLGGNPD